MKDTSSSTSAFSSTTDEAWPKESIETQGSDIGLATTDAPPKRRTRRLEPTAPAEPDPPAKSEDAHLPTHVVSVEKRAGFQAQRKRRWSGGLDWAIVVWMVIMHLAVLAAPFTFTWAGLGVMFGLHWLTASVGICLGFHRLFTHRSFETYRPIRWMIAIVGSMAGEGPVTHWVANHRKHHKFSDQVGDPHSPLDGPFWGHMLWFMPRYKDKEFVEYNQRWAPDLAREKGLQLINRAYVFIHFAQGIALFGAGYLVGGWMLAWSFLIWGMFVRMTFVVHSTWFVNSASHIWGYRTYETRDNSRNLWWVALLTYGEGWHNNHHAHPTVARNGHKWWELDLTWQFLRMMHLCGLAWNIVKQKPVDEAEAR